MKFGGESTEGARRRSILYLSHCRKSPPIERYYQNLGYIYMSSDYGNNGISVMPPINFDSFTQNLQPHIRIVRAKLLAVFPLLFFPTTVVVIFFSCFRLFFLVTFLERKQNKQGGAGGKCVDGYMIYTASQIQVRTRKLAGAWAIFFRNIKSWLA